MRRPLRRPVPLLVAAAVVGAGLCAGPALAQTAPDPVTVAGSADCGHAGPVGRYTVGWTVTNASGFSLTLTTPADETGTLDGQPANRQVDLSPNPVGATAPDNTATGTDGPITGTTTGTLTLTVHWTFTNGQTPTSGDSSATVTLAGDCLNPGQTVPSVTEPPTAAPTASVSPAATVAPVTATPAFTG
jgi:hypothetical protein